MTVRVIYFDLVSGKDKFFWTFALVNRPECPMAAAALRQNNKPKNHKILRGQLQAPQV